MNFLKTLGGYVAGNSSVGGLPYVMDSGDLKGISYMKVKKKSIADNADTGGTLLLPVAPAPALDELQYFELYPGHHRTNCLQTVSIFKSKNAAPDQLTQNALRSMKTLRHPNILSYLDGTEIASRHVKTATASQNTVWIVTEPVMPLKYYLESLREQYGSSSEEFTISVAWGLRSILQALKFINNDCKILHGRITSQSIFVTTVSSYSSRTLSSHIYSREVTGNSVDLSWLESLQAMDLLRFLLSTNKLQMRLTNVQNGKHVIGDRLEQIHLPQ